MPPIISAHLVDFVVVLVQRGDTQEDLLIGKDKNSHQTLSTLLLMHTNKKRF